MENEQILSVLTEILEEQKNASNMLHEIHNSLFNEKVMPGKGELHYNFLKFDEALKIKFDEMRNFIDQLPKVVEVKNRYLFFSGTQCQRILILLCFGGYFICWWEPIVVGLSGMLFIYFQSNIRKIVSIHFNNLINQKNTLILKSHHSKFRLYFGSRFKKSIK